MGLSRKSYVHVSKAEQKEESADRLDAILRMKFKLSETVSPGRKNPDEELTIAQIITGLRYGFESYPRLPPEVKERVDEALELDAKLRQEKR